MYMNKNGFKSSNSTKKNGHKSSGNRYICYNSLWSFQALRIYQVFKKSNREVRIVGGAVRDAILQKIPRDFDMVTDAQKDEILSICRANKIFCVPVGKLHGTCLIITPLKINPDIQKPLNHLDYWKQDAEMRDFTINALMYTQKNKIIDYFNGLNDLKNGIVKFINDPEDRIKYDCVRIFRYLRFYKIIIRFLGKFSNKPINIDLIDENVVKVIKNYKDNILKVPTQKIWKEFDKIISGPNAPAVLKIMLQLEIQLSTDFELTENEVERYREIYNNSCNQNSLQTEPVLKGCQLLGTFFTEDKTEQVLKSFKVSKAERSECYDIFYKMEKKSNFEKEGGDPPENLRCILPKECFISSKTFEDEELWD